MRFLLRTKHIVLIWEKLEEKSVRENTNSTISTGWKVDCEILHKNETLNFKKW